MNGKELFKSVVSSKSSIAAIGIIALCWITTVSPGQLTVDEKAIVSVVPMPKVPAAEVPVAWQIPLYITIITCLTVVVRGVLEYLKQRQSVLSKKISTVIDKILETNTKGGFVERPTDLGPAKPEDSEPTEPQIDRG